MTVRRPIRAEPQTFEQGFAAIGEVSRIVRFFRDTPAAPTLDVHPDSDQFAHEHPMAGRTFHQRRRRDDIVRDTGTVTLRHGGTLHHIGIGRTHTRTHIIMLIDDLNIRIVNPDTGELLRQPNP